MGSYKMHMCVTEVVRQKFHLSHKFVYGGILPDLIKEKTGERIGTHYLINVSGKYLPDVQKAIDTLDKKMDKEIRLGYIAHLVEDLVWFNDFVPKLALKENGNIRYTKDNTLHTETEYSKDMYKDYANSGYYVSKITDTDYLKLREKLLSYTQDNFEIKRITENTTFDNINDMKQNVFITKEVMDEYIKTAINEVCRVINEIM